MEFIEFQNHLVAGTIQWLTSLLILYTELVQTTLRNLLDILN